MVVEPDQQVVLWEGLLPVLLVVEILVFVLGIWSW